MIRMSRLSSICAIILLVLTSACNLPAQSPSLPSETAPATEQATSTPATVEIASATPRPAIPITGMDVVSLQCQFCVNQEAHAVLIMSNQAFFNVADPESGVTCLSAQEVNGRRILLCRGAQEASFTLNVCLDSSNCLEFPIKLQPCPLTAAGTPTARSTYVPLTPVILTPRNTLRPGPGVPPTSTTTGATATVIPPTPLPTDTSVSTPPPTSATEPPPQVTSTPEPATVEPPAPSPTSAQTSGGGGGNNNNLVICHVSQGNSQDRTTMTVSQQSWDNVHSQHGDTLGAC